MSRGPLPLKNLLRSCPSLNSLGQTLSRQQQLLFRVQNALPAQMAPHCRAVALKRQHLIIFADSPVWASRFRYAARQLAAKLPRTGPKIRDIRVAVHLEQGVPRRPRRRPLTLSPANGRLLQAVAQEMDDPALRAALHRLGRRART